MSASVLASGDTNLLRLPGLRLFVVGRTVSALGDSVHRVALALMIYALTGSAVAVGLVLVTTALPAVVLGPFAGAMLDRFDRRRLIAAAELARAPVVASLAYVPTERAVYAIALVANMLGFVTSAGLGAVVPDLFDRERLASVNSLTKSCTRLMHVVGPLVAGVVVLAGYPAAFLLDAATFVVSALSLLAISPHRAGEAAPPRRRERFSVLSGWHALVGLPRVRQVTVVMAAVMFVSGAVNVSLVVHLRSTLQLPDHAYAVFMSALGAGLLVGAAMTAAAARRGGLPRVLYRAILGDGLLTLLLAAATAYPLVLLTAFGLGLVSGLAGVASVTILQRETPEAVRGRVFATYEMCVQTLTVLSMAGGALVVAAVGTRALLLAGGLVIVVSSLAVAGRPRAPRRARRARSTARASKEQR